MFARRSSLLRRRPPFPACSIVPSPWVAAALVLASVGCQRGPTNRSAPPARGARGDTAAFAAAAYRATDGTRLPYRLLTPVVASRGGRYPLVLQLHGSGAIGTDNAAQLGPFATGWTGRETRARFPAYVLVPQFPSRTVEYRPADGHGGLPVSRSLPPLTAALELLDSLRRALDVDTARVYAVGFSMGGSSVWHVLLERPTTFAGAVVIAGVPPAAVDLERLPHVPLLLVHGTADTENPYAAARAALDALTRRSRGGVEFRAYRGLGHEIPADVLNGDWWRAWLFARRR